MATARPFESSPNDIPSQADLGAGSRSSEDDSDVGRKSGLRSKLSSGSDNVLEFVGNRTSDSEMITVEIDLTDPDDLARKLDMVDLTDEETDLLLERAQQLNVWLRHQLMRQSSAMDERHRHSATCIVSAPAAAAQSDDDDKITANESSMRRSRTFSGNSSLPPLIRPQGHPSMTAASVSYSRADHSHLAAYYSHKDPMTTSKMHRTPPSLHSVSISVIFYLLNFHILATTVWYIYSFCDCFFFSISYSYFLRNLFELLTL